MTAPKPSAQAALPFTQKHPLCPAPAMAALQESGTVHRVSTLVGDEAWLVTGYDQVRTLYNGDLLSRSHRCPQEASRATASMLFGGRPRDNYDTEDADRAWFREILYASVGPGPLRALRPWMEQTVTELLDRLAAAPKPADFIDLIGLPLPTLVVCKLLGIDAEHLDRYRSLTAAIAASYDAERSGAGLQELTDHLAELVAHRRVARDGLLWQVVKRPHLLQPETAGVIGAALMFTGHHTTAVAVGYALLLLLEHPDQLEALRADPAKLPAAIEECLRVGNFGVNTGGGNGIPTYARADMELDGRHIGAGELVLLDTGAANFDAEAFEDAFRFDIERHGNPHVTFGYGRHYCPGAGVARLELQTLFAQLLPRFPDLRLAVPLEELTAHRDEITGGLTSLPVTW